MEKGLFQDFLHKIPEMILVCRKRLIFSLIILTSKSRETQGNLQYTVSFVFFKSNLLETFKKIFCQKINLDLVDDRFNIFLTCILLQIIFLNKYNGF
jgi:hypothetical protein